MELPINEEDDEQVVRIPKSLKMGTTVLLDGEKNHCSQCCGHDPTSNSRSRGEVGSKESQKSLSRGLGIRVSNRQLCKIHHMRSDVYDRTDNDRPCRRYMEGDVLVKRNDVVERSATEERNEITANRKKDVNDIHVQDQSCSTGDRYGRACQR